MLILQNYFKNNNVVQYNKIGFLYPFVNDSGTGLLKEYKMNPLKIVACVLIGYLLGTISPSALLSKFKHINLRKKSQKKWENPLQCEAKNAIIPVI